MTEPFYITTPIYYVNDDPHLGHAYCSIMADVLARYHRLAGEETFFLTGVDEHGQKVQNAVRREAISDPQAYVDRMAERFKATWKALDVRYDDFIRTSEPRHVRVVEQTLRDLWARGEIYRGEYEGWYCVPDERFWTEKDLIDGACPDCGRPVERVSETNYFFRMGKYQDWLVGYLQEHPDFIQPAYRHSEVLGFLRRPLGDLCISRPISRVSWGIPLPFDRDYVTYVWFDALLNYVTAAGYLSDAARFDHLWPHAIHLIGKDILTTHSIYWLTMLKAMGLPLPAQIFAHGWWLHDGRKMSKSLGNVVKPLELAHVYGVDALRYFLIREMVPGQDDDYTRQRLIERYTVDLANNLGNLLHRVVSLTARSFDGILPAPGAETAEEKALRAVFAALPEKVFGQVGAFKVNAAVESVMDGLTAANGYLERTAPWKALKAGDRARAGTILYTAAEALRIAIELLAPVIPEHADEALRRLGCPAHEPALDRLRWGLLQPGSRVTHAEPLFPRLEIEQAT